MKRWVLCAALLFLALPVGADNGALLASQCFQCHGPNGRSKGEIDSLYGESAAEIYEEMREMKQDAEIDIMHAQAKIYSDAELQALANALAALR